MSTGIRSAGVIPFTVVSRDIMFLLGKECYVPKWRESDRWGVFGGRVERRGTFTEETPEAAAAREAYEETAGMLMTMAELRQILEEKEYKLALELYSEKYRSVCYFVYVPYDPDFSNVFLRAKHFVQYCKGKVDCIEKSQVKWFSLSQLYRDIVGGAGGAGASVNMPGFTRRTMYRKKFRDLMMIFFQYGHESQLRSHRPQECCYFIACVPPEATGDASADGGIPRECVHEEPRASSGDNGW